MVAQEFLEISGNQFFYAHDAINFSHSRSNRLSPGAEKCNKRAFSCLEAYWTTKSTPFYNSPAESSFLNIHEELPGWLSLDRHQEWRLTYLTLWFRVFRYHQIGSSCIVPRRWSNDLSTWRKQYHMTRLWYSPKSDWNSIECSLALALTAAYDVIGD